MGHGLQARLSALKSEGGSTSGTAPSGAAKEGPTYLQWRGITYTIYGERLKGFIAQAAEAGAKLKDAQMSGSMEEQLSVLEKLVAAFSEAKSIVRHSIATSGGENCHVRSAWEDAFSKT